MYFWKRFIFKKPNLILNLNSKKIIKYICICVLYNKFDVAEYVINNSSLKIHKKRVNGKD